MRAWMMMAAWALAACAPDVDGEVKPTPAQIGLSECEDWDEWERPARPFTVFGPVDYVGTCGITALLVETGAGYVLLDTGTEGGAEVVMDNLRRLGVAPEDVVAILSSHEHFDHVGGMAWMQAATGAEVIAGAVAAEVLRTGEADGRDPQYGMHDAMAPVAVGRVLADGESVEIGGVEFTMIATPGHTPGAVSWAWEACEGEVCRDVVYADSLSPVSAEGYRFSDHPDYVAGYRAGLERLAGLECDLLLTPHPSASGMVARAVEGFPADGEACVRYAEGIAARLDKRLGEEG